MNYNVTFHWEYTHNGVTNTPSVTLSLTEAELKETILDTFVGWNSCCTFEDWDWNPKQIDESYRRVFNEEPIYDNIMQYDETPYLADVVIGPNNFSLDNYYRTVEMDCDADVDTLRNDPDVQNILTDIMSKI